jgi:hypothetical protein
VAGVGGVGGGLWATPNRAGRPAGVVAPAAGAGLPASPAGVPVEAG